jgi:hypothetical protein
MIMSRLLLSNYSIPSTDIFECRSSPHTLPNGYALHNEGQNILDDFSLNGVISVTNA